MTKEQIRIKVAEALEYKTTNTSTWITHKIWERNGLYYAVGDIFCDVRQLPNYPESLDACAEFEKTLRDDNSLDGMVSYCNVLMQICESHRACVFATAEQRCLAFLKVKGLL